MFVIKLRGLPWSCTTEDIVKFMEGVRICGRDEDGSRLAIYLMNNADGRPSGEAFIKVFGEEDVEAACNKNNALMGQRYIEVFRSNVEQLEKHTNESSSSSQNWREPVVRLRGLPYGCEKRDILAFFDGLNTTEEEIMMVIDFSGRFNGEAFVRFGSIDDAAKALDRHKQKISNRYIEVFRSSFSEMNHYQAGIGNNNDSLSTYNANLTYNRSATNSYTQSINSRGGFSNSRNERAKPYARFDPSNTSNAGYSTAYANSSTSANTRGSYRTNVNSRSGYNSGGYGGGNDNTYSSYSTVGYASAGEAGSEYGSGGGGSEYGRGSGGYGTGYSAGHGIKMRGLPFQATESDISSFFAPLKPVSVVILKGRDRRPTGEAEVEFATPTDAQRAMEKDKKYMGKRYVELFLLGESTQAYNKPKDSHISSGVVTPPETTLSIGSLMNKNFNQTRTQQPQSNTSSLFTNFESGYNSVKPVPPPMGMNGGQSSLPPTDTSSTYSTNINELLMAEMAQKMFANAYTHYQGGQPGGQTTGHYPTPPLPPTNQQQHHQQGRFYKQEKGF